MVQQEVHPDEFATPMTSHLLTGGLMLGAILLSRLAGLPFMHSVFLRWSFDSFAHPFHHF